MSNAWIFSCNPQRYDLAGEIRARQVEVGTEDSWQANQRRREMRPGDTVYHWMTGKQAGIYAVSTLTSEPYEDENPRWPGHKWWVTLRFDRVLEQSIPKADLERHPVLKDLTVLRMPRLTNYLLASEQAEALCGVIEGETGMALPDDLWRLVDSCRMKTLIQWYQTRPDDNEKGNIVRQYAYEQIRRVIAPDALPSLTIEDFNERILQIGSIVYRGEKRSAWEFPQDYSVGELKGMFERGEAQAVGNCTWGFGAQDIRAFSKKANLGDEEITRQLQDALLVLQDESKSIKERLEQVQSVRGLWSNLATGILMALDSHEWIVLNGKSLQALERLGLVSDFRTTTDNYLAYNEFAKRVRDRYDLQDLAEVDAVFSRVVDLPVAQLAEILEPCPKVVLIGAVDVIPSLSTYLSSLGFQFPRHLLTTYYLSLQTKPFVILTGISGTGKTKLAQLFAEWISPAIEVETIIKETPEDDADSFYLEVHPSYLRQGFVIPKRSYGYFDIPSLNETDTITVELGSTGEKIESSLRHQGSGNTSFVYFTNKKRVREWLRENLQVGETLRFERVGEGDQYRLSKFTSIARQVIKRTPRLAFVSVRPDWTDNRGLLGFYNLITGAYQATDFLHLLVQATRDSDEPHFVILDEMNLAKVEYYFADFLSVLESRYRQEGKLKQEPLRLHDLPRCVLVQGESQWEEGTEDLGQLMCTVHCDDCPLQPGVDEQQWTRGENSYEEACRAGFDCALYAPPRLFVPRNVYFAGTVNVDETTYMFSPKVLDRANTIEFNEVDLIGYFSQSEPEGVLQVADDGIRKAFTFDGEFIRLPKDVPLRTDTDLAPYRDRLTALVDLLRPYNMHFGYRVVDEVLLYLWNSKALADSSFDLDTAFDHQLCQKILPKFHGSQAKLQEPLEQLLLFCDDPQWWPPAAGSEQEAKNRERISELKAKSVDELRSMGVRHPHAALKIRRMLDALEKEGFASFA